MSIPTQKRSPLKRKIEVSPIARSKILYKLKRPCKLNPMITSHLLCPHLSQNKLPRLLKRQIPDRSLVHLSKWHIVINNLHLKFPSLICQYLIFTILHYSLSNKQSLEYLVTKMLHLVNKRRLTLIILPLFHFPSLEKQRFPNIFPHNLPQSFVHHRLLKAMIIGIQKLQ